MQDQGEGGKANVATYHFYTGDNNIIVEEHVLAICGCIFCKKPGPEVQFTVRAANITRQTRLLIYEEGLKGFKMFLHVFKRLSFYYCSCCSQGTVLSVAWMSHAGSTIHGTPKDPTTTTSCECGGLTPEEYGDMEGEAGRQFVRKACRVRAKALRQVKKHI